METTVGDSEISEQALSATKPWMSQHLMNTWFRAVESGRSIRFLAIRFLLGETRIFNGSKPCVDEKCRGDHSYPLGGMIGITYRRADRGFLVLFWTG